MAHKPEDFPIFTCPDDDTVKPWLEKLRLYLHNIVAVLGLGSLNDLQVSRDSLYEIFTRIEKRRVYFHVFHDRMKMGEIIEGALLCFWILKLMPFRSKEDIQNSRLNTQIAYTIFVNLLFYVANKTGLKVNVKKMLMNNLLYAFQYRDLSKEALMALAESHLY